MKDLAIALYSTPSLFKTAISSAPMPSQAFSTSALCWPRSVRDGGSGGRSGGGAGLLLDADR
jgi:hypothetical protein